MSQTKSQLHSLKVRQKPDSGSVSTGANTEVFLDGQPLKGLTFLKFEFKATKVTKVQMEILAKVDEIDGSFAIGSLYPSNSEPVDKTQEIVDALLNGGLVFAPRESGKTTALARILQQDSTAVVFCDTQGQREALLKANNSNLSYENRIFMNTDHGRARHRWDHDRGGRVYIYEWLPGLQYPTFHAAITPHVSVI